MSDNKNIAMLEYLRQYPGLQSFLYFNSMVDQIGNTAVQTVYGEQWEKKYIHGHGVKQWDFAIVKIAPADTGTSETNADETQAVQDFMDWIDAQEEAGNYPVFEGCKVLSIENLQNMPNFAGIDNNEGTAKYMFQCRVRYYE